MATGDAINANSAGLVRYNGTGTFDAVTVTNHDVLVGSTSNGITSVGPGSAGQILQSGGASADPAYSTATYPSTTTINQVLYSSANNTVAEITAANNGTMISGATGVPSWLANGTTGQVLTATTGSPPSWGSVPSTFSPNSTIQVVEDFINGQSIETGIIAGNYPWKITGAFAPVNNSSDNTHIGLISSPATGGTSSLMLSPTVGGSGGSYVLGGGALTLDFVFSLVTLSDSTNRYTVNFGLQGSSSATPATDGIYVQYSDNVNSGQWTYTCVNASSATTTNSSVAVTSGWHHLTITINAAATSVSFVMDGVSLGAAITTNIPTSPCSPILYLLRNLGSIAAGTILFDLFYSTQTLTSAR